MKAKLTITIDPEILPLAKRYAKSKGVSLSSLVEQALRDMTTEQEQEQEPSSLAEQPLKDMTKEQKPEQELSFVEKWRGKFKLAERGTPRYEALVRKYLDAD